MKIGGFSAWLYHKEQPKMERQQAVCSRCLQRGHRVAECQNDVTCRACGESGHKLGDPTCSGERAVNNQPIGGQSGRAAGEVEQSHSAEQNQPSDAPDTWQSIGRCPIETAREETRREEVSSDEDPDWEECEEEREGQRPGSPPSTQHSQPSALPASQKTDGQTKQDCVRRGRDLSRTHDKKSKKPKAVKQTRMSLFTERLTRSHTPKRRREGDSPVSGDAGEKQFKLCDARGAGTLDHDHHLVRPDCVRVTIDGLRYV